MTTQTKYRKYEGESDYYAMGYRMYSAEFGRFLAVDPPFEAMPSHNPYHYSFNSPMFWSDPSGLVPVKEKVKGSEQLLAVQFDWKKIQEFYIDHQEETNSYESRWFSWGRYEMQTIYNLDPIKFMFGSAGGNGNGRSGGGGSSDNGTTKATASYGLRFNKQGLIERVIEITRDDIVMQIKMGRMDKPDGISQFDFDQKMIDGFNDILEGNPNYFDPLFASDSMINVMKGTDISDIFEYGGGDPKGPLAGLASQIAPGKYDIFIASELFTENHGMGYFSLDVRSEIYTPALELWMAIAHEFGHAIDYRTVYDYNLYNSDMRENSVIKMVNNLRNLLNKPIELYK